MPRWATLAATPSGWTSRRRRRNRHWPRPAIAWPKSTGDPQYLVYLPEAGSVTVDLSATQGPLAVEWFHPESGETTQGKTVQGGSSVRFQTPFESKDAVLYLCRTE